MKERPILFSGTMVRAILDGSKTQTRRVVKPQPFDSINSLHGGQFQKRAPYQTINSDTDEPTGYGFQDEERTWAFPYGKAGDRLWVRETFGIGRATGWTYYRSQWGDDGEKINGAPSKSFFDSWKPSIHMPRSKSRINLEITGVRVERLNDISEADAIAEGLEEHVGELHGAVKSCDFGNKRFWRTQKPYPCNWTEFPSTAFMSLWESINGPGSWAANPWVWVIEFKSI